MNYEDKLILLYKTLVNNLTNSGNVYIVPHINMDYDAIASASCLYEICKEYNSNIYIVTDDLYENMEPSLRIMCNELNSRYNFINTRQLNNIRTNNDLVIITDTNKKNLIPIDNINTFSNIIVIDHHKTDINTIYTDKLFIETNISSACEFVYDLSSISDTKIDEYLANILLSGIYLDTNRLSRNFKVSTAKVVYELMKLGANSDEVNNLFTISNFDSDRKRQRLIDSTKFYTNNITFTMDEVNPYNIYTHEDLARVADYLLQYSIDASFVMGYIDRKELGDKHKNLISLKARSKAKRNSIDVSSIMNLFNGGGDDNRAACIIEDEDIFSVRNKLHTLLNQDINIINDTINNKVLTLNKEYRHE